METLQLGCLGEQAQLEATEDCQNQPPVFPGDPSNP